MAHTDTKTTSAAIILVLVASIGGFLFGYDTGVVSGAMLEMKEAGGGFGGLSTSQQEFIVSSTVGAAAVGAALSGLVQRSSFVGRRTASAGASAFFAVGAIGMALSSTLWHLIIGRIIVGFAVGVASQVVPIYIAEVAPSHLRGTLNVLNNAMIVVGQVVASAVCCRYAGYDLQAGTLDGWRWMLGWGAVPAVAMLVGLVWLPESPRWLLYNRQDEVAALASLIWLRGDEEDARAELSEVSAAIVAENASCSAGVGDGRPSLLQRLATKRVSRALALGIGMQVLQQCIGINTIMYYSATILQMSRNRAAGCGSTSKVKSGLTAGDVRDVCWTVPISSCQLVGNMIGMALADTGGRRPLTLSSLGAVAVSLFVLGFAFYPNHDLGWLALGGMCIYLLAFGIGMSPMPWVVNAEIYPLDERSVANSIATCANWISNFIVAATFLDLARMLSTNRECPNQHPDGAFWLYSGVSVVGLICLGAMMPETRGKTLEEIDDIFK